MKYWRFWKKSQRFDDFDSHHVDKFATSWTAFLHARKMAKENKEDIYY